MRRPLTTLAGLFLPTTKATPCRRNPYTTCPLVPGLLASFNLISHIPSIKWSNCASLMTGVVCKGVLYPAIFFPRSPSAELRGRSPLSILGIRSRDGYPWHENGWNFTFPIPPPFWMKLDSRSCAVTTCLKMRKFVAN